MIDCTQKKNYQLEVRPLTRLIPTNMSIRVLVSHSSSSSGNDRLFHQSKARRFISSESICSCVVHFTSFNRYCLRQFPWILTRYLKDKRRAKLFSHEEKQKGKKRTKRRNILIIIKQNEEQTQVNTHTHTQNAVGTIPRGKTIELHTCRSRQTHRWMKRWIYVCVCVCVFGRERKRALTGTTKSMQLLPLFVQRFLLLLLLPLGFFLPVILVLTCSHH
jgi:hypothetical protein